MKSWTNNHSPGFLSLSNTSDLNYNYKKQIMLVISILC